MEMEEALPDNDADGELHGDKYLMAERVAAARPGNAIRINEVIERIIAHDNLERLNSPPARMVAPPIPKRAAPIGLNAHLPPFRRRVDSYDEEEPERPVWPPRRSHMEFDDGDYEQEEHAEPKLLRRRKKALCRANVFIDAKAGVDGDASCDKGFDDENDNFDGF